MKTLAHAGANILWRNAGSTIRPVASAESAPLKSWRSAPMARLRLTKIRLTKTRYLHKPLHLLPIPDRDGLRRENCFPIGADFMFERPDLSARSVEFGNYFLAQHSASLSTYQQKRGKDLAPSVRGGTGVRNEPARDCQSWAQRIYLHCAGNFFFADSWTGARQASADRWQCFLSDHRGHSDLRRQRHCRDRPDIARGR